ncbi:DNA topoisomerase [Escherichia coli]
MSGIWNDRKITAHHAIIPTRQPFNIVALSDNELKVYRLIRQHYLAQFFYPCRSRMSQRPHFLLRGSCSERGGRVEVVRGWRALFVSDSAGEEEDVADDEQAMPLPVLAKGDECRPAEAELKEMQTTPPRHYTEGTLIAAMKKMLRVW